MPFVVKKISTQKPIKAFKFLMNELAISQSDAQRLMAKGRFSKDGEVLYNSSQSVIGDYEIIYFEPKSRGLEPIFTHDDFAIYDKPTKVLVHPQNRYTEYCLNDEIKSSFGDIANVTHRIDFETSGLVVASRNKRSEIYFKTSFQDRKIVKKYLAIVRGHLQNELYIDEPLFRRDESDALVRLMMLIDNSGKSSQTIIKPLEYFANNNITLVEATPITGRQHQIRAHLFHVKHPIVGDPLYGVDEEYARKYVERELSNDERLKYTGADRLLLHANYLEFDYNNSIYKIYSKDNFLEKSFQSIYR